MKTYYYEGAAIVTPFTIASNQPVYDADTVSLIKQRASQAAQRWEISFNTVHSNDAADSFVQSITNVTTKQTMIMPQLTDVVSKLTITTQPLLFANYSAGVSQVAVSSASEFGFLPKGSFIKFSNHDKLYVVTADVDFSTGSSELINIFPSLRTPVSSTDTLLTGDDVVLTYYKDVNNLQGITYRDGILANHGTIALIEALA